MQDEKLQAVMVISFVACGFFFWFDLHSDWSWHNIKSKSNQSVHGFWIRTVITGMSLNGLR